MNILKVLAVLLLLAGVLPPGSAQARAAVCKPQSQERAVRCAKDMYGTKVEQSDYDCRRQEWGPWYEIVDKCVRCVRTSKTRLMRCPGNERGQITQRSDYKCPSMKWSGWYEVANTCD